MTELLVVGVIAVIAIAGAAVLGPRIGVAAPLVLVVVGIVASLLPFVPDADIEPEWILAGSYHRCCTRQRCRCRR